MHLCAAIVATDLQKPVNNVSKNVLLTKKTKMESYYVGSVPCPTRGPWFEPSNQTLPDIVEFSKLKKTRKRKKKKKGKTHFYIVFYFLLQGFS